MAPGLEGPEGHLSQTRPPGQESGAASRTDPSGHATGDRRPVCAHDSLHMPRQPASLNSGYLCPALEASDVSNTFDFACVKFLAQVTTESKVHFVKKKELSIPRRDSVRREELGPTLEFRLDAGPPRTSLAAWKYVGSGGEGV